MNLPFLPNQFAYVVFHLVVIASLVVSKLVYRKMKFVSLRTFLLASPVFVIFIIWDLLVTNSWWHFNPKFVLQVNQSIPFLLPIEEVLFFITVPFALMTLFENLRNHKSLLQVYSSQIFDYLFLLLKILFGLILIISFQSEMWYTFTIALLLLVSDFSYLRWLWVQLSFYFLLLTTLIFNYYLTYLPIVLYTHEYKSGILIGTIPVEDFGYAVVLFLWIVRTAYANNRS